MVSKTISVARISHTTQKEHRETEETEEETKNLVKTNIMDRKEIKKKKEQNKNN